MKHYKELYKKEIRKKMKETFNYKNEHQIPRLEKIVINRGLGEASSNKKVVDYTVNQFIAMTGQKPVLCAAKQAISNFKLRKGQVIGCKATLRSDKMYDFLSKLFNIVLPKIKDFRGLPHNSFDGNGNYTIGIKEDSIFPELTKDVEIQRGFDLTFVTSSGTTDDEALKLLTLFGLPLKKK